MKITNILLVEDSLSYREVVSFGLNKEPEFRITGEFNTADAALNELRTGVSPDIILLDLNLPGLNGLEAIPLFLQVAPESKILVLTESEKESDILAALSAGAKGYLLKESPLKSLIEKIYSALAGGAPIDYHMATYLLKNLQQKWSDQKSELFSNRELQVLEMIAKGLTQKDIAEQLKLSPKTIDFHLGQIYRKSGVRNAPAAIANAYETGILPRR